jgi:outer membrane protein TolC
VKKYILFLFLASWFLPLPAQQKHPLTLQECLQQARQHSFLAQSEQAQTKVATQQALLAKTNSLPSISGELAGEGHFLRGYNFGQEWALVQADWSLGDFLKSTSLAARQDVVTQQLRVHQKQLEAMGNAAILFVGILQTQKAMQWLRVRLQLMQKHKQLALNMWRAGLRSQLDVLQTQTLLSKLQEDSIKMQMQRATLIQSLALRLGWPSGDSLHVVPIQTQTLTTILLPAPDKAPVNNNLLVKTLQSKIKAQQMRVRAVEASRYPHLLLGGGFFADADPTGDGNYWFINGGIRIPLYEGKSVNIKKTASLAEKESLQYQLQHIRRETAIKVSKLMEKMNRLRDIINVQSQQIRTLQKSAQFAEVNFKAGLITNLEYLDIQQKLTDAQLQREQSRLLFAMSLIDYYVVTNQTAKIMQLSM